MQHPKFVDAVVLDRLIQAHERGVRVRVLCGGKHGISTWDILDTFASLRLMKLNGIKIRKQKHLRLHAKLLLADHKSGTGRLDEHRPQRLRPPPRARLLRQ